MNWIIVGGILVVGAVIWWWFSGSEDSEVLEVRKTADRQIDDLTVEQFRELGWEYLREQDFEHLDERDELAVIKNGKERRVFFDPAADARDPRTINQWVVQLKKSGFSGGVIITTRKPKQTAFKLAERADIDIIHPDILIEWQRDD